MSVFLFTVTPNLLGELFENKYLKISEQCVENEKILCNPRNMSFTLK